MKPLKSLDDYLSEFCLNCAGPKAFHDFSASNGKCNFTPTYWAPCTEAGLQQFAEAERRTIATDLAPEIRAHWSSSLRANYADTRAICAHYTELLQRLRECSGMTSL